MHNPERQSNSCIMLKTIVGITGKNYLPNGISNLLHFECKAAPSKPRSLETLVLHYLTNQYRRFCAKICAFFLSAKKERGFWMEWWFFMQSWDATPSRRWEMASPNNTEPYNGSDRRAIKQSGSQAFQISFTAHPLTDWEMGGWPVSCQSWGIPAGAWSGRAEGTSPSDLFSHSRH